MVDKLSDKEILNYLMTSEFEEGLTPDEFKFLLTRYRYYYRLSIGKNEQLVSKIETLEKDKIDTHTVYENNVKVISNENSSLLKKVDRMKSRNLTWKERFFGKIIDTNEDK
jgi:hypothetical protein